MDKENLVGSLEDSLTENMFDTVGDLAEVGLDAVMDDGILKDIPILSTVVGLYRIGHTIRERHTIKQLALFVAELNKGCADKNKKNRILEKLNGNQQQSKQEIEYILVVLDSYLEYEKPKMLAKLYMAYLEQRIDWTEFLMYAAILRTLLPQDVRILQNHDFNAGALICMQMDSASWLRLLSAGFVYEQGVMRFNDDISKNHDLDVPYSITKFGQKFIDIVG